MIRASANPTLTGTTHTCSHDGAERATGRGRWHSIRRLCGRAERVTGTTPPQRHCSTVLKPVDLHCRASNRDSGAALQNEQRGWRHRRAERAMGTVVPKSRMSDGNGGTVPQNERQGTAVLHRRQATGTADGGTTPQASDGDGGARSHHSDDDDTGYFVDKAIDPRRSPCHLLRRSIWCSVAPVINPALRGCGVFGNHSFLTTFFNALSTL